MMQIKVRRRRIRNWDQHEVGKEEHLDGKFSSESNNESVGFGGESAETGALIMTATCPFSFDSAPS